MTFKIDSVPSYVRERISREGTRPMSDLLDLALKAHGGLDRWREVKSLDARVSLTGALYHLKGYPEGVPNVTVKIDTRRPAVTISPYARPDHRGYFTPDRVWIEDRAGQIVDERRDPRASFAGHVRETPWDQLHRLYFTSYAMWNHPQCAADHLPGLRPRIALSVPGPLSGARQTFSRSLRVYDDS